MSFKLTMVRFTFALIMGKRIYSDDIEWTLKLNLQEFIKSVEKSGKKLTALREVLNFTGEDFKHLQTQVDYPISSITQLIDVLSQNRELTFGFDNAEYESFYHLIDELHVAIPQFERVEDLISSLGLNITDLSKENADAVSDLINVEDEISKLDVASKGYFTTVKEFFDNLRSRKNIVGDIYSELKYWQKRVSDYTKNNDIFGLNDALNQVQKVSNLLSGLTERDIFTKSGKFVKKHAIHEETITHNINDAYLSINRSNYNRAEFDIKKYEELIRYQSEVYNRLNDLRDRENNSLTQSYQIAEELSKSLKLIADYKEKLSDSYSSLYSSMLNDQEDAINAFYDNLELRLTDASKKLENGEIVIPGTGEKIKEQADAAADAAERAGTSIDKTNDGLSTTVDRLKEINAELKQLRKADPKTDEEFQQIQAKIKALTEERNKLTGKGRKNGKNGKNGKHGTPGTYKEDSLEEVTAPIDLKHQQNMLNLNKRKDELTEAELIIKKSEEIIRYEHEVVEALQDLANKTDATHIKTLDKIKKEQQQSENNILAAQEAINNARVSQDEEYYGKRMEALKAYNDGMQVYMQQAVNRGIIQEEQANIYRLQTTIQRYNDLLRVNENYHHLILDADNISENDRIEILKKSEKKILKLKKDQNNAYLSIQRKFLEMTEGGVGLEGMARNYEREVQAVAAAYDAMVEVARANGLETVELERQKLQKLRDLEFEYQEELWGIKERLGVNWQEEYDHEVSQFRKMLDDEIISQSQFEKKLFELRVLNAKKWFDYYHGLSGSMFGAIQQAEIDQSDAKYDVLIRQAENAGEDTAALEEEKENKKLEIQKKYADVNFAIKISQIVADTAVAIMKAFADLGPIGGAIAAALLTATGVAQVVSAKAERDKVKRLQPKSGAGQAIGTAERVLSGYSEGGYTGDGRRLEVAGVVHRGEYVVPQPIMGDPRVVDAVGMIEAIRRQRRGLPWQSHGARDSAAVGFADGGYTGGGESGEGLAAVAAELRGAVEAVRNLRAYIVYQDIEKAGEVLTSARAPFTRKG